MPAPNLPKANWGVRGRAFPKGFILRSGLVYERSLLLTPIWKLDSKNLVAKIRWAVLTK